MVRRRSSRRQRVCCFCERKQSEVDYRDPVLSDFLTEKGKIVSRRVSGLCARHQRRLARAVKNARTMAILA